MRHITPFEAGPLLKQWVFFYAPGQAAANGSRMRLNDFRV